MLMRTRSGWSMLSADPASKAASAASASERTARLAPTAEGSVSATSRREPPRTHWATTMPPLPSWTASSTRARPDDSILLSRRVFERMSCTWSAVKAAPSMMVSATGRFSSVSVACQNCRPSGPPCEVSRR
ncbi:Uncharacterised protein [Mycobacteroides abscessus]|nr:Uncharacterised protein [Mycobacteroides abscessus]